MLSAGVFSSTDPRAAAFGAGTPPAPAVTRPPKYRPANSTSLPPAGVNVELEELNVTGSRSTSTGTMANPLLLSPAPLAVPACAAAQPGVAAGQVISVLPVTQIAPRSLAL